MTAHADLDSAAQVVQDWAVTSPEQEALLAIIAECRTLREDNTNAALYNYGMVQRYAGVCAERDEARARVAELEADLARSAPLVGPGSVDE